MTAEREARGAKAPAEVPRCAEPYQPTPASKYLRFDATADAVTSYLPIESLRPLREVPPRLEPASTAVLGTKGGQQDTSCPPSLEPVAEPRQRVASRRISRVTRVSLLLAPLVVLAFVYPRWAARGARQLGHGGVEAPSALPAATQVETRASEPAEQPEAPPVGVAEPASRRVLPAKLQRAAVDRVAAGDTSTALGLYRQLLAHQPDNTAFREAVRILEESQEAAP